MSTLSIAYYFTFERMKVTNQTVNNDGKRAYIEIEPDKRFHPVCHMCKGTNTTIHCWESRDIRDLPLGEAEVLLKYTYRKVYCSDCNKIVVEELDVCQPRARMTNRFAWHLHDMCKSMSVKDVAERYNLGWHVVKNVDKYFLEKEYGTPDYDNLKIIAVDEIALKKGHQYITEVLNYETGEVIWMGKDRRAETLIAFFNELTVEQRKALKAVAMDMWDPYIKAVKDCVPHVEIVFDLFHVVAAFGRVIDHIRITEYNKASAEHKYVFKGSKYLLLKNTENIKKISHRQQLKELCRINETINTVLILRDQLKHLWDYVSPGWAMRALAKWIQMAMKITCKEMKTFCKRLLRYFFGIVSHCKYAIHNSKLEGVNNKIKLIKRIGYGYHDQRYFFLKVKQAFAVK